MIQAKPATAPTCFSVGAARVFLFSDLPGQLRQAADEKGEKTMQMAFPDGFLWGGSVAANQVEEPSE